MANVKTKILLFGRTGSGKSTIANMLIKGNLDSPLLFETSPGIRGKTMSFQIEENDAYLVVDTVGFGEMERGTVSDVEAGNRLYDFFTKINETGYNYFAYVHKWGKLDELDTHLWSFFKKAFEGAEQNFVLLFTHCKDSTLAANLEDIRASFEGCSKYIAVDFPPRSSQEGSNPARARKNEMNRDRSLKCLQEGLEKDICPLTTPSLRSTMRKGRLLLLGRCASARNMIAKLLVNGTLDHNPISGKKETQQGEASSSSSTCESFNDITPCVTICTDEATAWEEVEGRGWQVVNFTSFEHMLMEIFDSGNWALMGQLQWQILKVLFHGSYSHIIYIEQCGDVSEEEKLMQKSITWMLMAVKDYLVAIIVETKCGEYNTKGSNVWSRRKKDIKERFRGWKTLQLPFPDVSSKPDAEREHFAVRSNSLHMLEEALGEIVLPHFSFQCPTSELSAMASNWKSYFATKQLRAALRVRRVWSPGAEIYMAFRRTFVKNGDIQPVQLSKMSDLLSSSQVAFYGGLSGEVKAKVILLELKVKVSSIEKITVRMTFGTIDNAIDRNRTGAELQVVDMHHVEKNTLRLVLNTGQWTEGLYPWSSRHGEHVVSRSKEDVFLDNIGQGDTIILWLLPDPVKWTDFVSLDAHIQIDGLED